MNPIPAKVFVLVIDNDVGLCPTVHRTRAQADAALLGYVSDNWASVMCEEPMPTDQDEAIDAYFAKEGNDDRAEIGECEVEG